MTVSLPPDVEEYLEEKTAAGFYPSISEAIRDGVRLMKERDALDNIRLESLRAELAKGVADFECGDYVEYENADDFLRKIEEGGRKILAKRREAKA